MIMFFFYKQKTAYDVRISDCSSDVCSSDLMRKGRAVRKFLGDGKRGLLERLVGDDEVDEPPALERRGIVAACEHRHLLRARHARALDLALDPAHQRVEARSEEHTSELQSLMRNSYAVFCLKKKKTK